MTQKEKQSIKAKEVFAAIKLNPQIAVVEDFFDYEGHGYWTAIIRYMGMEFSVDMQRRDFSTIVYEAAGSVFYKVSAEELEEALAEIIEDALAEADKKIQMLNINKGLGLI